MVKSTLFYLLNSMDHLQVDYGDRSHLNDTKSPDLRSLNSENHIIQQPSSMIDQPLVIEEVNIEPEIDITQLIENLDSEEEQGQQSDQEAQRNTDEENEDIDEEIEKIKSKKQESKRLKSLGTSNSQKTKKSK